MVVCFKVVKNKIGVVEDFAGLAEHNGNGAGGVDLKEVFVVFPEFFFKKDIFKLKFV